MVLESHNIQTDPRCLPMKSSLPSVGSWHVGMAGCISNTLFTGLECGSQSDSVFHQICIEGNIASGKTTCLDYFAQTTNIEVLDAHCFVLISVTEQLLVLDPWGCDEGGSWGTNPTFLQSNCSREM